MIIISDEIYTTKCNIKSSRPRTDVVAFSTEMIDVRDICVHVGLYSVIYVLCNCKYMILLNLCDR